MELPIYRDLGPLDNWERYLLRTTWEHESRLLRSEFVLVYQLAGDILGNLHLRESGFSRRT